MPGDLPVVLQIFEEAPAHLPAVGVTIPEGGNYYGRAVLTCRHTRRSYWFIGQTGDWVPEVLQAIGLWVAFPLPSARSRSVIGDRLGLDYDQRDWVLAETRPPREAVLKFVGGPGPLHVRFDQALAPPTDEQPVREATRAELAAWRAGCVLWEPASSGWEDVAERMERRHDRGVRGERSALADLAPELRERLVRYLARVGAHLELRGERANELHISTDEEQRLCALAEKYGFVLVAGQVAKGFDVVVLTDSGREVVRAVDPQAKFVECGKEGWLHAWIARRVARTVCAEAPESRVLRSGTAYLPPADQVQADLVLLVPGNAPDGSRGLRVAVQVQCSGNGEREANCAIRLARVRELTQVLVVSRNARMALETDRRLKRLLKAEPAILAKIRVTDAGKVIDSKGLVAFVVSGDPADLTGGRAEGET